MKWRLFPLRASSPRSGAWRAEGRASYVKADADNQSRSQSSALLLTMVGPLCRLSSERIALRMRCVKNQAVLYEMFKVR